MLRSLIRRNVKMFFRDKGLFFTSLITPMILLVLYVSFLGNVYRDSFSAVFEPFGGLKDSLLEGCVGGQLVSSILAVCCVTVSFCSNFLMVQDKITGAALDFSVTPLKSQTLALSYYIATVISTLTVCLAATAVCFLYMSFVGWYLSLVDVMLILLDVVLLVLFGTVLSSIINTFLSTQGQISAVGSIVSSVYGFLCGAYMPISQFSPLLQKILAFLPGTYGTSLLRNHAMGGVFRAMEEEALPKELIDEMRSMMDCRIFFFDAEVLQPIMYAILGGTVALLIAIYIFMNRKKKTKA